MNLHMSRLLLNRISTITTSDDNLTAINYPTTCLPAYPLLLQEIYHYSWEYKIGKDPIYKLDWLYFHGSISDKLKCWILNKEDSPGFFCKTSKSTQLDEQRCREGGREGGRERHCLQLSCRGCFAFSCSGLGVLVCWAFSSFSGPK
jgi:hypothetical protein